MHQQSVEIRMENKFYKGIRTSEHVLSELCENPKAEEETTQSDESVKFRLFLSLSCLNFKYPDPTCPSHLYDLLMHPKTLKQIREHKKCSGGSDSKLNPVRTPHPVDCQSKDPV